MDNNFHRFKPEKTAYVVHDKESTTEEFIDSTTCYVRVKSRSFTFLFLPSKERISVRILIIWDFLSLKDIVFRDILSKSLLACEFLQRVYKLSLYGSSTLFLQIKGVACCFRELANIFVNLLRWRFVP